MVDQRTIALRELVAGLDNVKRETGEVTVSTKRNTEAFNAETLAIKAQTVAVDSLISARMKQLALQDRLAAGSRNANFGERTAGGFSSGFGGIPNDYARGGFGGGGAGFTGGGGDTSGIPGFSDPIRKNTEAMKRMAAASQLAQQKFDALNPPTEKMKGFGATILKNIGSFIGWSIAMSLVMIPLRLITDAIEQAIQAQEELAEIAVVLGRDQELLSQAFHNVAEAAEGTGVSINDALDAYSLVLKITSDVTNENERMAKSNKLLADSLTLSKLAGIDSAEAIDALAAAMNQLGIEDTTVILDTWVRTSNIANVSMEDLALASANAGEAAQGVGLTFEELNASVAILAQNTTLSSKEMTNALEAMFGGFTKQASTLKFARFGIDTRDLGFLEIARELKGLQDDLDPKVFDDLASSLVGRKRLSDLKAYLAGLDDFETIMNASADSTDTAAKALEALTETPKSAIMDLTNELQELFFTLGEISGEEGSVVKFIDSITESIEELTKALVDRDFQKAIGMLVEFLNFDPTNFGNAGKLGGGFGVDLAKSFVSTTDIGSFSRNTATPFTSLSPEARRLAAARGEVGVEEVGGTGREGTQDTVISQLPFDFAALSPENQTLFIRMIQERTLTREQAQAIDPITGERNDIFAEQVVEGLAPLILQSDLGEGVSPTFEKPILKAAAQDVSGVIDFFLENILPKEDDKDKLIIKELPFGAGQLPNFEAAIALATKEVEKVTGKKVETEEIVVALKDGSLTKVEANQKIMNLVLDQIEENTRDIVRGVFNLPSGADIFVPLAAAENAAGFGKEGSNFEILFREFMAMFETSMESRGAGFTGGFAGTDSTGSAVRAINIHLESTLHTNLHLDGEKVAENTQRHTTSRLNKSAGAFGGATRRVMV